MDLLDKNNKLDLNDPSWKIYTEDVASLPQYIGPDASINRAFITQGCIIDGAVTNSVIFTGTKIGEGAKIIDSVLMPGAIVEDGATVTRALVAEGVKIGKGATVGSADSEHIELVSKRVKGVYAKSIWNHQFFRQTFMGGRTPGVSPHQCIFLFRKISGHRLPDF